jgi:predicted dehydrogenase
MSVNRPSATRREFLKNTGRMAGTTALAGVIIPRVHIAEDNTIRLALIGCGTRGTDAVTNAVATKGGPVKLAAMADVFPARMQQSCKNLKRDLGQHFELPPKDRQFIGFDAYRHAMDCLKPGDVAMLTTPPAFRWPHFAYAIEKGLNVFMEKPTTVDGPTTKKMLALADESEKKNLKVGVGLMIRHCRGRQALKRRIEDGEIGEIIALRAYRQHGPVGYFASPPRPANMTELLYQVERFHSFLWASGGAYSDFYVHQIDECCWMKGAWPIEAQANGGRHYHTYPDRFSGRAIDQNFDNYSVEYVFADGARLFLYGRAIDGCDTKFASYAQGSKGLGVITRRGHTPGECRTFKGQNMVKANLLWRFPQPEQSPYQLEWDDLLNAIRRDKPYNEARRGAEASLVTSMGRMAAHTGRVVTLEEMRNCPHEFAPDVDKLTLRGPAPLLANADGKYPVPEPGIITKREY